MDNQDQNQNQGQENQQNNEPLEGINQVSQSTTNTLIGSVLRKHGVTKDKMNPVSDEQKQELRDMVENLKHQLNELQKQSKQTYTADRELSKKARSSKENRRRKRL